MIEVEILLGVALVWIIFAVISDIKTREIPNWLNFSLVIFALGFRFFYSLFELGNFEFFYYGLGGFVLFFILGNIFYYSRMFAGGDMKLMMALGPVLPVLNSIPENIFILVLFLFLFILAGSIYGILMSAYFGLKNFINLKKEFKLQFNKKKKFLILFLIFSCVFLIVGFFVEPFFYIGIFAFIFPYFYLYLKSVDEVCMVRKIKVSKLTEGDWLYKDIIVGNKVAKASWDGLSKKELNLLKKRKKDVLVRYGIQYAPVFLISFILLWVVLEKGWFNLFLRGFGI